MKLFPFILLALLLSKRRYREFAFSFTVAFVVNLASFLWFAPIFSFQTYITWRYRYSCEFRTLALVALLMLVLRHRFPWTNFDEPQTPGVPFTAAPSR